MAKTTKPKLTEFTPEPQTTVPTRDSQLLEEYRNKMKMFAAGCDRELQRIATEKGVRIGDTVIHEASLCAAVSEVLQEHKDLYSENSK